MELEWLWTLRLLAVRGRVRVCDKHVKPADAVSLGDGLMEINDIPRGRAR